MGYKTDNELYSAVAEVVFNHYDFSSSVESVIDDYDMGDKINDALKDHDFGVSDLSYKIDNVENLAEDAIDRVATLEADAIVQLKIIRELITSNEKYDEIIKNLLSRIEQLEAATASVDWDETLTL